MALPAAQQALHNSILYAGDGAFAQELERELRVLDRFLEDRDPFSNPFKGMMHATKPRVGYCPVCSKRMDGKP
jgi:hypothetical protein